MDFLLGGELDGEVIALARTDDHHTSVMLCQWLGIHCGLMWGDYDENILYVSPLTADSHMSHPSPASRSQKSHVNYLIYHYYNYCQLLPAFLRSEIRNGTKQGAAICDQCPQERLPLFLC